MRIISGVVGCLFLVFSHHVSAFRHNQRVGSLAPAEVVGDLTSTLETADTLMTLRDHMHNITKDMKHVLSNGREQIVNDVCSNAPEDSNCREVVNNYADRCEMYGCFTIDNVKYPLYQEYQPLSLPNPYQLDAAFRLFKESASNPAKNSVKREWLRFRNGANHGDYHYFVTGLLNNNVVHEEGTTDVEYLVNKVLYMATMNYKTYLTVNSMNAKFFNRFSFTTKIFSRRIKQTLSDIIRWNVPEDFEERSIERITQLTSSYEDYMLTQIPTLSKFARRYADMVKKVLLGSLTSYVEAPWYKRWIEKFRDFFSKNVTQPTKKFIEDTNEVTKNYLKANVAEPTKKFMQDTHEKTKGYLKENVAEPTKTFFKEAPQVTKHFFDDNIGQPTKEFFREAPQATKHFLDENIGQPTKEFFREAPQATKHFLDENIAQPTKEFFKDVPQVTKKVITENIAQPTKEFLREVPHATMKVLNENIAQPAKEIIHEFGTGAKNFISATHEGTKQFLNETVGQPTKEFLNGALETTKDALHHLGKSSEEANPYDATENTTQANDSTTSNGEDTAGYL
uniref:Rhoptry associated protein-1 n=1 Tax=Babesia bovis TaxID=5865 RepID=Q9U005_BABBO|nr:rhoptry associated protein-1 [Babesia bovis]